MNTNKFNADEATLSVDLSEARQFTRQQNPTIRTRRLGNANIQTVNQIDPMAITQPGLFAPIFKG